MAEKKSPKSRGEDPRFEEFLQKQFAELKRELGQYASGKAAKEGKVLSFDSGIKRAGKNRGSWKYGIAAAVLAAVAVPMVIQFNRQRAEYAARTEAPAPAADADRTIPKTPEAERTPSKSSEKQTAPQADLDSLKLAEQDEATEKSGYLKAAPAKAKKKAKTEPVQDILAGERNTPALKASREEAAPKDAIATGKADDGRINNALRDNESDKFFAKKEEAKPALAQSSRSQRADNAPSGGNPAAPASPPVAAAPAPAARPAITRSAAPSTEISGSDRGAAMAQGETVAAAEAQKNSRSIVVDDSKARLKKQDARDEEKAEMEKLWKEFEQDPKSFNQDKKRSARLRTLLSRHNEKSRARRMKSVEMTK